MEQPIKIDGNGRQPESMDKLISVVFTDFPQVLFAILFGSAAKGRLTAQSDVDIAVAANKVLSVESRCDLAVALSCALGREVDLIDLQAVSGPILEQALCSGRILKNNDHDLYAGLMKRLWYNQADMMMASQKVRPPALQRLFKTLTYNMYAFTLEQPLRLGGRNFCLAI